MRLRKLTMKAFGSYAKETVIDFDSLDSGLYLVRGNTGSGKTTIFDAIVFALYGESSGGGRTLAMMHSDFVDKTVDTELALTFEHNGVVHEVTRVQKFKKGDGPDGYVPASPTAMLVRPGHETIITATNVTKAIKDILGLDATQFRQIVMLAQGAFRQFLEANSSARTKILSTIFATSKCRCLQERFKTAADILRKKREADETAVQVIIQGMVLPDDATQDDARRLKPLDPNDKEGKRVLRSPTIVPDLEAFIERERVLSNEAMERFKVIDEGLRAKEAQKATAEYRNGRLDTLEDERRKKLALDTRKEEMDRLSDTHRRCTCAAKVQGFEKACDEAKVRRDNAAGDRDDAKTALATAAKVAEGAAAAAKGLDADRARVQELATEGSNLEKAMASYDRLATSQKQLDGLRRNAMSCRDAERKAKVLGDELGKEIAHIDEELAALTDSGAEAALAQGKVDNAIRIRDAFQGVCTEIADAAAGDAQLVILRGELERLSEAALKGKAKWDCLYSAFVRGQAGLMADDLAKSIRATGEGTCPVCGTVHSCVSDGFASRDDKTPTETEVDEAKRLFDAAEVKRGKKQSEVDRLETSLQEKRDKAIRDARALPGCEDVEWGSLAGGKWRVDKGDEIEAALGEARRRRDEADAKVERQKSLSIRRQEAEEDRRKAEADAGASATQAADCENKAAGLEGEISQLRTGLAHATRSEAEQALEAINGERSRLMAKVATLEQRDKDAQNTLSACASALKAREENLTKGETDLSARRSDFERELAAAYADEAAYRADLALLPKEDVQRWLNGMLSECNDYAASVRHNAETIAALEEETRGFERMDVGAIVEEIEAAQRERALADSERSSRNHFVAEHERILKRIRETDARLAGTEAAMNRLEELSLLSNGGKGSGTDRMDFESFMLGDCLREVLEQANMRLDVMSGGRFELVHRSKGRDNRSSAGLDIDVLDHVTGGQRLAATFSGGEGFQASMSLALGLADTVRNHAGDVQLDSTFIDEGFGSLDDTALENCVRILKGLAGCSRQVGIISHVAKLEEDVWPQIVVESGDGGSTARIEKR